MSDTRSTLVLHLAGAIQPLHVALASRDAESLSDDLPGLMAVGETRALTTADGKRFVVNFGKVATAHIESARAFGNAYGVPSRGAGFGE